jgi:hypothetical protein
MEITATLPTDSPGVAGQKRFGRSKLTNGSKLLPGIDGRSAWVRRCKDVIAELISDRGGADNCSAAERSIIRRAAVLTTELERMEAQFAVAGEASSEALDCYARIAANLRRLLQTIGLERRAKPAPTMREFLASLPPHEEPHHADEAELADD